MRKRSVFLLVGTAASVCVVAAFAMLDAGADGPGYRLSEVTRGDIVTVINASGTLRPPGVATVVSTTAGVVREVVVGDGAEVVAGQILARLDDRVPAGRVEVAEADVAVARGNVEIARGQLERAAAGVAGAQATRDGAVADVEHARLAHQNAESELRRVRALATTGDASRVQADSAASSSNRASAALDGAKANLATVSASFAAAQSDLKVAKAQVENALLTVRAREASLHQAELDLDQTRIRSPMAGLIATTAVGIGQFIGAGSPVLYTIFSALDPMYVYINVNEADIGRVAIGDPVSFTVDAFPGETFPAEVVVISRTAQVVQGVVTYNVAAKVANPERRLLDGMTATVQIITDRRENVVRVVNAALRFAPSRADDAARSKGDVVWVLDPLGVPVAQKVRPGVSDGVYTELAESEVAPGQEVIIGMSVKAKSSNSGLRF